MFQAHTSSLSVLDLALIGSDQTASEAFSNSVALAQHAEARGYRRVWYAEHHNMAQIASSSPAVLIAHVANHTSTIRLGAGGVMLPNHSPLLIAEQFATLSCLHPDRIDLGLGRAPGSDQAATRALRREPSASERFADDVIELDRLLRGTSGATGVQVVPSAHGDIPLWILGSSMFGAKLAARLGLPYAFASHFAPRLLHEAMDRYRTEFEPSERLTEPYAIAALNVIAADDPDDADRQREHVRRRRVGRLLGRGRNLDDAQLDRLIASPQGQQLAQMMHYTAVGTGADAASYVRNFAADTGVDEVIVAFASPTIEQRLVSLDLLADAIDPVSV